LASASILGCGGGGGSSSGPPPTAPKITWATPAAITYGTPLSSVQLDATANVPGSFSYSPAAGAVLSAGTQTLSVTFTPNDTKDYTTATDSVSLTVNQATPVITWPTPANIVPGTVLSATQLDATANTSGTFNYTPSSGTTMSSLGGVTLSTTFTPTDATDYTTATASVSLFVVPNLGDALVDYGTSEQLIRGFGASEAWYSTMPSSEITTLYDTASGDLGLSIMRLRIAPTTWTSATQTADTSAWVTELGNGEAAQVLGATIFATPWTPPASMKSNNNTVGGSLNTASYADYANYLQAYANFAANQGVNLYAISMQNEPDANVTYESCAWTGQQMDTWIAQNSSVLTTKLMMPESEGFNPSYSDPALNDPSAVAHIAIIAGHLYGASPSYYANAESKGKEVWMTEHYLSPTVSGSSTTTISDAIAAALEIHNSMTVAQYNAYVWWWAANASATGEANGLIDTNYNPTYFGYGMAQFSLFVRPGYLRYNATPTPVAGVYLSAYGGNGHQVIVVINSNSTQVSLPIQILNQTVTSMTPYQTTSSASVSQLSAVTVTNSVLIAILPAQSITTYVQ
jgi:glucuronoarabinoxylan endo-1,4-beta-xylanase